MKTSPHIQDSTLESMVQRLVSKLSPNRIYLFGSRGRNEGTPDSDYDLMVVVPSSTLPRWQRDQAAFRALCGVGASKDVLVYTQSEFDAQCQVPASLPSSALHEGQLLYAI
jgi:hypothetical protein